jgi:hypothetical protein
MKDKVTIKEWIIDFTGIVFFLCAFAWCGFIEELTELKDGTWDRYD